ncbi:MAG: cold-shock protein [Candidatus Liberibacter europaeus]|uniref:Cold-shock protein n=1 Tax=Candidatus Liberibacter europaeus TaxID=744859 RepID=A0A2T4VY94_9HYPH|nr:cold-shock protein [Candidatus Liberibacter europaeus]PTL86747.1 MAG: cold-shock protein [Candidatus Liberibacter europaeus]
MVDIFSKNFSNSEYVTNNISDLTEITGVIKWFDIVRGFGFFTPDDNYSHMGDVLLHVTYLRWAGYHTICAGDLITAIVQKRESGYQTFKILSMKQSELWDFSAPSDDRSRVEIANKEGMRSAIVKWFDRVKRFGFLTVEGISEDVFVHMEIIRKYSLLGLYPKQAVLVRLDKGEKGFMVTEIYPDTSKSYIQISH